MSFGPQKKFPVLLRVLAESRACVLPLLLIELLSLISLPLTLLYPLPVKLVVDNVVGAKPVPHFLSVFPLHSRASTLFLAIALLLAIAVIVNLQGLASWWLQTYTGEKLA